MASKKTAAKGGKEKGARKAEQGKGNGTKAEVKAKGEKVQVGKKFLKKWDLAAAPSGKSPQFKRFKTNAHLKQFIEDQLANGLMLKGIAAELKVTPARVWEMAHQLGIDIKAQKARTEGDQKFRKDLKVMEENNLKHFGGKKAN